MKKLLLLFAVITVCYISQAQEEIGYADSPPPDMEFPEAGRYGDRRLVQVNGQSIPDCTKCGSDCRVTSCRW